jgi:fluoride exporter
MAETTNHSAALTGDSPIGARPCPVAISERLAIAVGGAAGAYTRVMVNQLIGTSGNGWPWATFGVNIAGAFLLGYLIARLLERLPPSTYRRPLLGTGFCGALTTFSTLQFELLNLIRTDHPGLALAYATSSAVLGFAAFMGAIALVRRARVAA